jgi:circadian clock protein KaiB
LKAKASYKFRLFVAGDAQNSAQALANLNTICEQHLHGRYEIEVVDVFREPLRALAEKVLMTPMLVKLSPLPALRIVGTLSETRTVLDAVGLAGIPA